MRHGQYAAKKIMSARLMVTGDLMTTAGLFVSQKFQGLMGSVFQSMARRAKKPRQ
jgi:hypothetical protein